MHPTTQQGDGRARVDPLQRVVDDHPESQPWGLLLSCSRKVAVSAHIP